VDKASEDYFRQLGKDYSDDLPDSYSALEKGKLQYFLLKKCYLDCFSIILFTTLYIYTKLFLVFFKIEKQGKFCTILNVIVSFKNRITELDDQDTDFFSILGSYTVKKS
jgi:hypothetical protein